MGCRLLISARAAPLITWLCTPNTYATPPDALKPTSAHLNRSAGCRGKRAELDASVRSVEVERRLRRSRAACFPGCCYTCAWEGHWKLLLLAPQGTVFAGATCLTGRHSHNNAWRKPKPNRPAAAAAAGPGISDTQSISAALPESPHIYHCSLAVSVSRAQQRLGRHGRGAGAAEPWQPRLPAYGACMRQPRTAKGACGELCGPTVDYVEATFLEFSQG